MKTVLTLLLIFSVGSAYAAQETVKAIIWPLIDSSNPEESNKTPLYSVDRSDELDQLLDRSQEMLKQKNIPDDVRAKTVTNMAAIQIVRKDFSGNPRMALLDIKNDNSLPPLISVIAQYNLGVYHDLHSKHHIA